ncbi:MAG: class I SAM-dependent methyltransferase [Oscillospiraceae bacterium]|nr:class I SAM-dependent methyltransferase [Oscillospiraceae bacterium]
MREMQLNARLWAVAEKIPPDCRLLDVGTDHARLPIWLLQHGRVRSVIASDLRKGPLEQARKNLLKYRIGERIQLRQCAGLTGVSPEETDVISICGMGGETILHILEDSPWAREKRLILQPQSNLALLRRFLQENGYAITEELLCQDRGYFYVVWMVSAGEMPPLSPGEAHGGRLEAWVPDACWRDYLEQLTGKMAYEVGFLERSVQEKDFLRRDDLSAALSELRQRKENLPW